MGRLEIMLIVGVCVLTGLAIGCVRETTRSYELSLGNRSAKDILSVTVVTGTVSNQFGFLAGKSENAKTSAGCRIEFSGQSSIEWEEDEVMRRVNLDLGKYKTKQNQIKGFRIFYRGNLEWDVQAE